MPSSPSILREFLIAVGFKVDDREWKAASSKLELAEKQIESLGKIAIGAGIAIAGATLKIAELGERLFFAAQRGQTSVKNLQALEFAARNVGLTADQVDAALANMATNLRTNLAAPYIFRLLGVKQSADDTENLIALLERIKSLKPGTIPYVQATNLIASQLGVDEPTLNQMLKNLPQFEQTLRRSGQINKNLGLNPDKFAEDSHKAMSDMRDVTENAERLSEVFATKLLPELDKLTQYLGRILDFFDKISAATNGWSTVLAGVAAAFGLTSLGKLVMSLGSRAVAGLLGGGGAAAAEGAGVAGAAAEGGEVGILGGPVGVGIGVAVGAGLGYVATHWDKVKSILRGMGDTIENKTPQSIKDFIAGFEGKRLNVYDDGAGNSTIGFGHRVRPGENFSGGITDAQAQALLQSDTASAQGSVQRLVKVPLSTNQMKALVDFVYNFGETKFANSALLRKLNSSDYTGAANEFLNWNKMMQNGSLQPSEGLAKRRWAEYQQFTRPDFTLNQETNIHVTGGDNPKETGRIIGKETSRSNGDLLRNMQGAVQ
jgi:lysozyme